MALALPPELLRAVSQTLECPKNLLIIIYSPLTEWSRSIPLAYALR